MALRGCCGLLKYLVVLVNLICWLAGLLMLVLATWLIVNPQLLFRQQDSQFYLLLYTLLAVGSIMFIVGFLGCTGACRESQCMLVLFFCFLLLLLVAQIAAGAWAYTHEDRLDALIEDKVMNTVKKEYTADEAQAVTFDNVQKMLECCGAKNAADWALSSYNQKNPDGGYEIMISSSIESYRVPPSCCLPELSPDECDRATQLKGPIFSQLKTSIYTEGCAMKIVQWKEENKSTLALICVAIVSLELMGLLFSIVLCCAIRSVDRYKA
ncbi:Hypothetical predicted protein [Cloeon dipterum]|uniref:Tetraspanin n=2 Tax=Cloeon dipterum TaxID=197152 RepID=A0A8S1BY94_9INSE|nr:Hypothetical predicted protein [Cloeon dipterum]